VKLRVNGAPVYESSKSAKKSDAVILRDKLLAQRHRGEITGGTPDKILIDALLDDVIKSDIEKTTRYIWEKVVEKNIRPFFGNTKAARLSTDLMDQYRVKRRDEDGVTDATVNRELSILRTAFHNASKRTPPKVNTVPYFPMGGERSHRHHQVHRSDADGRLRNPKSTLNPGKFVKIVLSSEYFKLAPFLQRLRAEPTCDCGTLRGRGFQSDHHSAVTFFWSTRAGAPWHGRSRDLPKTVAGL
jgi:hypothetical protein